MKRNQDIISGIYNGNKSALEALIKEYGDVIYGLCVRMLPTDELANTAFSRSLFKIWNLDDSSGISAEALFAKIVFITRKECVDILEKSELRGKHAGDFEYEAVTISRPERFPIDLTLLHSELNRWREENRMVLDLAFYDVLTPQEIAKKLKIPAGTIKTRARNAVSQLKSLLTI